MYQTVERLLTDGPKLNLNLGSWKINPSLSFVILFVFLLFLLVLTLAQVRRHFMDWSFKGSFYGFILGFALALILEAFLALNQTSLVTSLLTNDKMPKPFSVLLTAMRQRVIQEICR